MTNTAKKLEIQKSKMILFSQVLESEAKNEKMGFFRKLLSSLKSNSPDELDFERWQRLEAKPRRSPSQLGRWI